MKTRIEQLLDMAEDGLVQFAAVSLREGGIGAEADGRYDRWRYPSIRVNGLTQPLKMANRGRAVVEYDISERREDISQTGEVRHGAEMRILSIDPLAKNDLEGRSLELRSELGGLLTELADRGRDDFGRFVPGQAVAGVDDFRAAAGSDKRKMIAGGTAAALVGAGGYLAGTAGGRKIASGIGQGVVRGVKRVLPGVMGRKKIYE